MDTDVFLSVWLCEREVGGERERYGERRDKKGGNPVYYRGTSLIRTPLAKQN